jgi:uncharacterized membrane protein YfcA
MNLASAFADVSLAQLGIVAAMAMLASILGGLAGYGTGALMPLVLVPIVGAEPVVPMIATSALMINASRAIAFRNFISPRHVLIVIACAIPSAAFGAYIYTTLTGRGASIVIGSMMVLSVPLRRVLRSRGYRLGDGGLAAGAAGWGVVVGGTTGAGIILMSLLMAAGLEGIAVIATDAAITILVGTVKISVFGLAGAMTPQVIAMALLIGIVSFPGAFIAKAIAHKLPVHIHTAMLDAVVMFGGGVLLLGALLR